jgi:hypothetical protein
MGYPAEGLRSIVRNSKNKVMDFMKKIHNNKVKIYNLCDDSFINTSILMYPEL